MRFYTNVSKLGSSILYRGYDNGRRIHEKVKFKPTLFLPSKSENPAWFALDDTPVEPMQFDTMTEAKDFIKQYEGIGSFKIFGNDRWTAQFIQERFPDEIHFDRNLINITTLDIEVEKTVEGGYSKVEDADNEIIAIGVKNNIDGIFHLWGLKPYDVEQSLYKGKVEYRQFRTEQEMLKDFISWFAAAPNIPDIITGWNSRLYDIPYIVNRIAKLFGEEMAHLLSPWGKVEPKDQFIKGRPMRVIEILGITQLDYLDLFKKFTTFTYGAQESYKLGHIAHVVLDDRKLSYEEYSSLQELYEQNPQKFFDYNLKDIDIVDRLEDKLGLITLALTLAYIGGVNYSDTLGTTAIWDSIIFRDLARKRITVPFGKEHARVGFAGGYVKDPVCGMHDWVCSFDLNSLYPSIIMQYNMSPETIVEESTPGCAIAMNGAAFRTDKPGVLPRLIGELIDKRVTLKKAKIAAEKVKAATPKSDKTEHYRLDREIMRLDNHQTAVKILNNSCYGAMSNLYFRYYDLRIAEGITLTGQAAIKLAEKTINDCLNGMLKVEGVDHVIAMDTDSCYISMKKVIEHFKPVNALKFLDEFCNKGITPAIDAAYSKFAKDNGCTKNYLKMKRESIADRGVWTAKKRYILNVLDNEGVRYAEPEIKIMGIEAIKSSTPEICRDAMKEMFKTIMTKTEAEVQAEIAKFRTVFEKSDPIAIAFPRGCTELKKYSSASTIYTRGVPPTPIHVRGALLFNHHVKKNGLDKKYELILPGDKLKFIYLKKPNPIQENVVSFIDVLPPELNLVPFIDYDTQFEKTFLDPINIILDAVGWRPEKIADLTDFFS